MKQDKTFIVIVVAALIVYGVTAFNSHGFYHADEHYQLIEFAGRKLGTHSPDELAWEYKAKIRSAIQPTICFGLLKLSASFGIADPYVQAFLLRFLTALLAIGSIGFFASKAKKSFTNKSHQLVYLLFCFFLWFTPMISVRFSSESWSGIFFLFALAFYLKGFTSKSNPFILGLILGISFLFRFQIAFAILGFFCWAVVFKKQPLAYILKTISAIGVSVAIGFIIDSWFYGEMVFTPWNYFHENILEGAASSFGTSPWYYYLEKLLAFPSYFVGIPLFLSIILVLLRRPKSLFLWCFLFFIVGHSLIPHKEERFIFPMIYLFPLFLVEGYLAMSQWLSKKTISLLVCKTLLLIFIAVNTLGLVAMATKSAGIGRMELTKHIHRNYDNQPVYLVFCSWANPYNPWHSIPMKFYQENNLTERRINDICELREIPKPLTEKTLLVIRKADREKSECGAELKKQGFIFEKQSIPKWIEFLNSFYKGIDGENILELYRYENPQKNQ